MISNSTVTQKSALSTYYGSSHKYIDYSYLYVYCDRLYVLKQGQLVASGTPEAVLHPDLIRDVYGVWSEVSLHSLTGKLTITFFPEKVGRLLDKNNKR